MPLNHTPPVDLDYQTSLLAEHTNLETVDIPIITVSATYRQHIEDLYHDILPDQEVTFSRAHYSMAAALLVAALKLKHSAWITDPTNFVSKDEWGKILFTHEVARFIARHNALKPLKDAIDTRARNKLPISDAIDDLLIYLTAHVKKPLLSLHYEAGNIAHTAGHKVVQVVTDPHVRPKYLLRLPDKNMPTSRLADPPIIYAVFDEDTKTEFLHKADLMNKTINPNQVVVTGPPVDPRLVSMRSKKLTVPFRSLGKGGGVLNLAITTGGKTKSALSLRHFCQ